MYSPVTTLGELEILAGANKEVFDHLVDTTHGRRIAANSISELGWSVSDKLVRTWRERHLPNSLPMHHKFEHVIDYGQYNPIPKPQTWITPTTNVVDFPTKAATISFPKVVDKDKKVIAFGDFQINKHDPEMLDKAVKFVKDQKPDMICLTGDESDNTAVGRWAKGTRDEYEVSLQEQIDETIEWLTKIREAAPAADIHMAHSNHMHWITKAIETRLPGFDSLRALTPEKLYELDDLGIQYQRKLYEFLPNFLLGHGHQWQLTSGTHRTKGIEQVMKTGCSILAGHVHQATLETAFIGFEGKGEQKVYVNPGCMMDFEKAMESNGGYVAGTSPNWSKGIVVIHREAGRNFTELVLANSDKSFRYEGRIY